MAGILDSVNQLTELVGQNRLELLLFSLPGRSQRFGINVFKVREVLQCPRLTVMPKIHRYVRGVAHIRGQTISVIDLSMALVGALLYIQLSFWAVGLFVVPVLYLSVLALDKDFLQNIG